MFWCRGAEVERYMEPLRSWEAASVFKLQRPMGLSCEMRMSSRCQNIGASKVEYPPYPYLPGPVFFMSVVLRSDQFSIYLSFFNLLTS